MSERDGQTTTRNPRQRTYILIGVVVLLIVAWLVSSQVFKRGDHVTPNGGSYPQAAEGTSTMPATPPSGDAPGTPAAEVNGPSQPSGQRN